MSRISSSFFKVGALVLTLTAAACLPGQTKPSRLQEAAQNLNLATRFGRMDIAYELVGEKNQVEFAKRHQAWGGQIRIVDLDFQGMSFDDADKAKVFVTVGWQRLDEGELRVTQVSQTWLYGSHGWKLSEETRTGGDFGLLGENSEVLRPGSRGDTHFKSITIREQ
jgi:hypothetical protein